MRAYAKNTGKIHISEIDFFAKPKLYYSFSMFSIKKLSMIKVQVTLETIKAKLRVVGMDNVSKDFLKSKKINEIF